MENLKDKIEEINKQIKKKNLLKALTIFLVLTPIEKNKIKELDNDLLQKLPILLKTVGDILIYKIDDQIELLSTSTLGNKYLRKF